MLSGEGLAWNDLKNIYIFFFSVRVGVDGGCWEGVSRRGGHLSFSVIERKDVLGNSNKLARSFVGFELRSHCSPYWRGL